MGLMEILRALAALAVTLGLVGLAAWAFRRYGPPALVRLQALPAQRRLSVIETLMLDPQRRLVLVRVDQTECLLLLGEGRLVGEGAPAQTESPQ